MGQAKIEQALRTWIEEANSTSGRKSQDVDSAQWVTAQFIRWWRDQVGECLDSAEYSAACVRDELSRRSAAERSKEMMHEVTHLQNSLSVLRQQLGLIEPSN
ncbi:MAG: hypothetical protein H6819_04205 [Phycisphaerales bacterium]|nr:hypothetical protein [Phycisphaerales bacterium]MCB9856402.1 hypothetical protein [Phycisphaerales bacterium]MCB9864533.1 hypothetical protein [Phycisphaerales bacterium]